MRNQKEEGGDVEQYIRDIIHTFTTGDEKTDMENIETIVETVHKFTGKPKENIQSCLEHMRNEYYELRAQGKTDEEAVYIVESKAYKNGVLTTKVIALTARSTEAAMQGLGSGGAGVAGGFLFSPVCFGFAAILLAAQTTVDYKKVKAGRMDKKEFKRRLKLNGVGAGGGILGASAGGATGFLIGSAIFPGIGSAVGAFAGALVGGVGGNKLARKTIEKMDKKVLEA